MSDKSQLKFIQKQLQKLLAKVESKIANLDKPKQAKEAVDANNDVKSNVPGQETVN